MPWRLWTAGDVLATTTFQSHIQDQCVLQFADAASRDSAIPSANRVVGMTAYTAADDTYWTWTGSEWRAMVVPFLRKTGQASVANSTTLTDTPLSVSVPANSSWAVECRLVMGYSPHDVRYALSVPAGSTVRLSAWPNRPAGGTVSDASRVVGASPAYLDLECAWPSGTNGLYVLVAHVAVGPNAGSITLQMAQNTAGASATNFFDSVMFAWRVA